MARLKASSWCSCLCSSDTTLMVCCCCGWLLLQPDKAARTARVRMRCIGAPPSALIVEANAGRCSLGPFDRILNARAAGEGHAHPAILERLRLGEDPQVYGGAGGAERQRFRDAGISKGVGFAIGKDHGGRRRAGKLDRGDGQAEDCAQVKL